MATATSLWKLVIGMAFLPVFVCQAFTADEPSGTATESAVEREARMKWWKEARFGMFVHWGLFSAAGGTWKNQPPPFLGCWMQQVYKIPAAEYEAALMPKFTGERFDPDFIAKLAEETGMKYIVPITKHHEGFCLFDTKHTDFNITNTPARRDWIRELADASRKRGLKVGFYYSQDLDWHHPGGGWAGDWDPAVKGDPDKYVDNLVIPQLRELLTDYGDVSIMWFDMGVAVINEARAQRILKVVHEIRPNILINNRLGGGFEGDYDTPEQQIPGGALANRAWETCQTMNGTWEYTHYDRNWKSATTLVRQLIDTASKGGNFLLNIGPKPDGTIPQSTIDTLRSIGGWMKVHGDTIYGTSASPFKRPPEWGRCTQKALGNGITRLYLHIFSWPFDSVLRVPPLRNEVVAASLMSPPGAGPLEHSLAKDGTVKVKLPIAEPNDHATVVVLDVKGTPRIDPDYYAIMPNAKGDYQLDTVLADVHGSMLRYQAHYKSLGWWFNEEDYPTWLCRFEKPGRYEVEVTYGCNEVGGGVYAVEAAGKSLVATTTATKDWFDRRTDRLGILEVDEAGVFNVAVRVRKRTGVAIFDLQSVVLRRVE